MTHGDNQCYTNGTWVTHERALSYDIQKCGGNGIPNSIKQTNKYQYDWVPSTCDGGYKSVQKEDLLEKMRNEWMTFIGDSLSRNTYYALVCLLYDEPYQSLHLPYYDDVRYYKTYNATVVRMWSSFLVVPDEYVRSVKQKWPHPEPELGVDITIKIGIENSTILVLGTGGWWGESYRPLFMPSMVTVFEYMKYFSGRSVFQLQGRTTHYPCYNKTIPVEELSNETREYDTFRVVLKELEERYKHVLFLKTEELSEYRVDGHPSSVVTYKSKKKDCQHWILPGVPDTWIQILFNYVLYR